ncbi:kinesin-like protein Klp68D isoform X2 [Bombina bombina]|uniref:kinesin-like protein Klp68D isoform X2 n=1 Tax=Bombina bombina TaxID=8345 RepID=UPI00235A6718|nr:kinesin-like protein Klp68D isoform X2 [Bombina bombina]
MSGNRVIVTVGVQPLDPVRLEDTKLVQMKDNKIILQLPDPSKAVAGNTTHEFTYDFCYWRDPGDHCKQKEMLRSLNKEVLDNVSKGYNSCFLSYGHGGSETSSLMMGTNDQPGLLQIISSTLLSKQLAYAKTFPIEFSCMEISSEDVRDLLQPRENQKNPLMNSGINNLSRYTVSDYEDIKLLIERTDKARCLGNSRPRKSHIVYIFSVTAKPSSSDHDSEKLLSKIILVDLAISGTAIHSGEYPTEQDNHETLQSIIYSLTGKTEPKCKCLEDSLLAKLLQTTFGGNCKPYLLVTLSPRAERYRETLSLLKLIDSVKSIEIQVESNQKSKVKRDLKRKLQDNIQCYTDHLADMYMSSREKVQKTKHFLLEIQETNKMDLVSSLHKHDLEPQSPSPQHPTTSSSDNVSDKGTSLGIICWDRKISWLLDELKHCSDNIREKFKNVTYLCEAKKDEWKTEAAKFSSIIFFHSVRSEKKVDDLQCFLNHFISLQGQENVHLVLSDLKNTKCARELRTEMDDKGFPRCEKTFFTEAELDSIFPSHKHHKAAEESMKNKLVLMFDILMLSRHTPYDMSLASNERDDTPWHKTSPQKGKHKVGIFTRCASERYNWLETLLKSEKFSENVQDVRSYHSQLTEDVSHCTFGILYYAEDYGKVNITPELKNLSDKLGKTNVIVVIDDVKDSSKDKKQRILEEQPSINDLANELLLFNEGEVSEYKMYLASVCEVDETELKRKLEKIKKVLENEILIPKVAEKKIIRHTIGIFTRAGNESFAWLQNLLSSKNFRSCIQEVRTFNISNTNRYQFIQELSQCTFGILYHTKNHGRLNITDVTDSMYDTELRRMSTQLGKDNVIVVLDDLSDSSTVEKLRILDTQPKIKSLTKDLILVSEREKKWNKQPIEHKLTEVIKTVTVSETDYPASPSSNLNHTTPPYPDSYGSPPSLTHTAPSLP